MSYEFKRPQFEQNPLTNKYHCRDCREIVDNWRSHNCGFAKALRSETAEGKPKCTCGPHANYIADDCPLADFMNPPKGNLLHPVNNFRPRENSQCLRCNADWPAGETHVCADHAHEATLLNVGPSISKMLDPGLRDMVAASFASLNCPTCNRPILEKGLEAMPEGDTDFVTIVTEFMKVDHLQSAQQKVERLSKMFRFVKRDVVVADRED